MTESELFETVRRVFAPGELGLAPAAIVATLRMPESSKRYLTTVGLPIREVEPNGIEFNLIDRLPILAELYPAERQRLDPSWQLARFVQMRYGAGMYLDEEDGGTVWEIDVFGTGDARFVNSSVELLGYFVAECNRPRPEIDDAKPYASRLAAFRDMQEILRAADPAALAKSGNWWPMVLDDAETYL